MAIRLWRGRFRRSIPRAAAFLVALAATGILSAQPPEVPAEYRRHFVHFRDDRSLLERALNAIGLTDLEVGRSFALVAGVDSYPHLPAKDRTLAPARVDLERLVGYLKDYEFFDEIVVLRNEAVTDANFKYFLQVYLPGQLRKHPRSRLLFAYSGHGIQEGPRGYLLQSGARSFEDLENAISLESLTALYRPATEKAFSSLALINACHSGSFGRAAFGPETSRRLIPREPGAHVITAGSTRQLAWHIARVGDGSVFFEKLLAGLGGRADDQPLQPGGQRGDGVITATELYGYLSQEVQLETDQAQVPRIYDLDDRKLGSFFFLNRNRQVLARNVPAGEGWRTAFGFEAEATSPAKGEAQLRIALEALSLGRTVEANRLFGQACELGHPRACAEFGRGHFGGTGGLSIDLRRAVSLFQQACDGGEPRGCAYLGKANELGRGVARSESEAVRLYNASCDAGDLYGCASLGVAYATGLGGLATDETVALRLFRRSCDGAVPYGCHSLGIATLYGDGGLAADEGRAVEIFRRACDGGEAMSCYMLGSLDWKRDEKAQAFGQFERACDGGDMVACLRLGDAHWFGDWTPRNERSAIHYWTRACDGGLSRACTGLAFAHSEGRGGLERDEDKAGDLWARACDDEDLLGCTYLGISLMEGTGRTFRDEEWAGKLFQEACDGGQILGCYRLGLMKEEGLGGLMKEPGEALRLYQMACGDGNPDGCRRATDLGAKMSGQDAEPEEPSQPPG